MNGAALTYLILTIVCLAGDILIRLTAGPGALLAPYFAMLALFGAVVFTILTHLALDGDRQNQVGITPEQDATRSRSQLPG